MFHLFLSSTKANFQHHENDDEFLLFVFEHNFSGLLQKLHIKLYSSNFDNIECEQKLTCKVKAKCESYELKQKR